MSNKFTFLKPELKAVVDRVSAKAGDVLVVRPRDRGQCFTGDFLDWLQQSIAGVSPPGVRALIINEDTAEFATLSPGREYDLVDDQAAYEAGWHAAFEALEAHYNREVEA